MEEDDYLLDDDENIEEDSYYQQLDKVIDGNEDSDDISSDNEGLVEKTDPSLYKGKLTDSEIWLSSAYDDIVAAARNNKENAIEDAVFSVVMANPKHTSTNTVNQILKELFHKQGHSRMRNSVYVPDAPLRGEDVALDYNQEDDSGFNKMFADEARNQIARFIGYLANRDLSKDSIMSKRRKLRQIPAFIIFLFSSGMYDLIIDCPTMPKVYNDQINRALEKIMKAKYDIVEELAMKYEEKGRQKVADRVRKMQLSWFYKEPAEIRTSAEYSDLDLVYEDVVIYREYRSKFTNTSKAITQDVISDLIEVVVDERAGVYEKLKDKTRALAISDVKEVYKEWSKENPVDSELASKVIWKEVNEFKN